MTYLVISWIEVLLIRKSMFRIRMLRQVPAVHFYQMMVRSNQWRVHFHQWMDRHRLCFAKISPRKLWKIIYLSLYSKDPKISKFSNKTTMRSHKTMKNQVCQWANLSQVSYLSARSKWTILVDSQWFHSLRPPSKFKWQIKMDNTCNPAKCLSRGQSETIRTASIRVHRCSKRHCTTTKATIRIPIIPLSAHSNFIIHMNLSSLVELVALSLWVTDWETTLCLPFPENGLEGERMIRSQVSSSQNY